MQPIITPTAEVADRYTIAKLKLERLPVSEADPKELRRQVKYYEEGLDFDNTQLAELVVQLYLINGEMWDAEYAIRQGQDDALGLEEIGRRALHIRDLNKKRMDIKNQIVDLIGDGFKDCKMNSATYAQSSESSSQ